MEDATKQFLTANKELLIRNDFNSLFRKIDDNRLRKDVIEFLYNTAHINPLKYMDTIPEYFFGTATIPTVEIPANIKLIKSWAFTGNDVKNVIFGGSDIEMEKQAFDSCYGLSTVTLPEGMKNIPERLFNSCRNLKRVNLPKSVLRIRPGAFDNCAPELRIVTPYRESKIDKLTIPSNEIDFYKEHLRFTHAPKENADEI